MTNVSMIGLAAQLVARGMFTLMLCAIAHAQQTTLTIDQAVQQAVAKYPSVRGSLELVSAAEAGINLARTSYLPRVDLLGQVNRATRNNVFGLLLPQSVLPAISGPVLGTNSLTSVWGTAAGGLVSWEPFDFGLRKANVDIARAGRDRADAQARVTSFQVASAAADAFLSILATRDTVTSSRAGVERARTLSRIVDALVKSELRAGAEGSRARAELALAQTQLIQAEEAVDVNTVALAQLLGVDPSTIALSGGKLLQPPPGETPRIPAAAEHPAAIAQSRTIAEVKARETALNRTYFPRFNLQGALYGRGTGANNNGTIGSAGAGLLPETQNWGLGMTVTFPVFDFASLRARKQIESHNERAESARYDQVLQDLNGQMERARAVLLGARKVAQNTPVQLEAARQTEKQAAARYQAGLASIVEVAEAERILTQAEIDDALARLGVWRASLGVAIAGGDLEPFLQQVKE